MKETTIQSELRSRLIRGIIRDVLLIGLGVLMIFFPQFSSRAVALVVGWILIAVSAIGILTALLKWNLLGWGQLLWSAALAGFGAYIVLVPGGLGTIFGIVVGIGLLLSGLVRAFLGFRSRNFGGNWVIGVLGLVLIGLGVWLLVVPRTAVQLAMLIAGIALLVSSGLSVAMNIFFLCKLNKLENPDIIDAQQ